MSTGDTAKLYIAASSKAGKVRTENEDSYYFSKSKRYLVVSDGMGGHQKGELASKFAGETIRDMLFAQENKGRVVIRGNFFDIEKATEDMQPSLAPAARRLLAAVRLANRRIHFTASQNGLAGMGTTVSAVLFEEDKILIAHVGDSRVYRLRNGELVRMTRDHSWISELLEDNEISEVEAGTFKDKNVLTRALGIYPNLKVDLHIETALADDLYLVCSDGLHNALSDELIRSVLAANHGTFENKINKLVAHAEQMDGSDNITGGIVHLTGDWNSTQYEEEDWLCEEESPKITEYLDQFVRSSYGVPVPGTRRSHRNAKLWTSISVATLLLVALIFQLLGAPEVDSNLVKSALLSQTPVTPSPPNQAKQRAAGDLVLLQLRNAQYYKMLEQIQGIRVLDRISELRNGKKVHEGVYDLALTDNSDNVVYRKKNITLKALAEWPVRANAGNQQTPPNTAATEVPSPGDQAHVFLLGSFDSAEYNAATIFVDESRFGTLSDYRERGFFLPAGTYTIEIREQNERILKRKTNVFLNTGETVAIEF
jgi:protein phosphatase